MEKDIYELVKLLDISRSDVVRCLRQVARQFRLDIEIVLEIVLPHIRQIKEEEEIEEALDLAEAYEDELEFEEDEKNLTEEEIKEILKEEEEEVKLPSYEELIERARSFLYNNTKKTLEGMKEKYPNKEEYEDKLQEIFEHVIRMTSKQGTYDIDFAWQMYDLLKQYDYRGWEDNVFFAHILASRMKQNESYRL